MSDAQDLQVEVDEDLCVGTGECVRLAPKAFELDEGSGVAVVLPTVGQASRDELEDAAMSCPTQAISLKDAEGNEVV